MNALRLLALLALVACAFAIDDFFYDGLDHVLEAPVVGVAAPVVAPVGVLGGYGLGGYGLGGYGLGGVYGLGYGLDYDLLKKK